MNKIWNKIVIKFLYRELQILNELEFQICKSNQNSIKKEVAQQFNNILIGLFEDYFDHEVTKLEKIYV